MGYGSAFSPCTAPCWAEISPGSQTVSHGERAEDRVGTGSICGACCRGGRACRRGAARAERADESVHVVAAAARRVLQCVEMAALMPAVPTPPGVLAAALGTSRCATHMQPPEVLTPGRLSRLWWTRVGGRTAPAHRTTPRATPNREPNPGLNPEPHPERGPDQVGLRVHHRLVDVLLHDADGPTLLHERTRPELTRTPRGPRAVRTCGLRVPAPCGLHVEEAQGSLPRGTVRTGCASLPGV